MENQWRCRLIGRVIDLTGQRFGKWTVLSFAYTKNRAAYWNCKCDCGTEKIVSANSLRRGSSKSCGCDKSYYKPNGNRDRLIGKKFNHLTVIAFDHYDNVHKDYWKCRCDCGSEEDVIVQGHNLTSGAVKSCGCLRKLCQFEDLTGQTFGDLTVLEFVGRKNLHSYYRCRCTCGNEVTVTANNLKRGHTTTCGHATNCSKEEQSILDIVQELKPDTKIVKARRLLDNKDIDIYIPEYNLGIEYNGSVYHATLGRIHGGGLPKLYHQQKFLSAKEKGINLISIFDVDWRNNQDKIVSVLKGYLGLNQSIYARKCNVVEVQYQDAKEFCDKYHLQGFSRYAKINIGLEYNDQLISLMSFGNYRLKESKEGEYELHRFVTMDGYSVVGGASKIFKYFLDNYNPKSILSYSDNDYFSGSVYERLGFENLGQVEPGYYWFKPPNIMLKREQCQVHKLKELYPDLYDDTAPNKENDIMLKLKYCKVYRSGNTKWLWRLNNGSIKFI